MLRGYKSEMVVRFYNGNAFFDVKLKKICESRKQSDYRFNDHKNQSNKEDKRETINIILDDFTSIVEMLVFFVSGENASLYQ